MDKSLTPIPLITPTPSELGEDEEISINTKHFSRNARLHDPKTVEVSARRSLRLTPKGKEPVGKKTSDLSKTKSSTKSVRSSKPPASSTPNPGSKKIVSKTLSNKDKAVEENFTEVNQARANKRKLTTASKKDVSSTTTKAGQAGKKEGTTAAERRHAMASTSKGEQANIYNIKLDAAWYEQQGAAYRKAQADAKAKKQKEKENPMMAIMEKKATHMARMTASVEDMAVQSNVASAALAKPSSEVQLWADSLVPHVEKLDKANQRKFMLHVMSLAFDALDDS